MSLFTPEFIRDVSEAVYRRKLDRECGQGTADMERPPFKGQKQMTIRERAGAYDKVVRLVMEELNSMGKLIS